MKFDYSKTIKDIRENNDFFEIDYEDLLENFDTDDTDEKVRVGMQLSLVNVAFLDATRGMISRPRYLDKIISIYRKQFIEDVRYRIVDDDSKKVKE